jgi:catalase
MPRSERSRSLPKSFTFNLQISLHWIGLAAAVLFAHSALWAAPQSSPDLAQQIYDVMAKIPSARPKTRPVHAKGIVCEGTFTAAPAASKLSSAAHFKGGKIPVTVRLSDGAPDPSIPDNSPNANPRGIAIRFALPGGDRADIVAISHNGFIVANGEEFLALQKALLATLTNPSQPHPLPIEQFLGRRPRALKFVQDPNPTPESFATLAFYGNNAFVFVDKKGKKQAFRYQIIPVAGVHFLDDVAAKTQSPNYLADDLRARLAKEPVKYRLVAQLPNPGDTTNDSTIVWPDRKTVELGTIAITAVVADSDAAQKALAFDPILLTDGIELSDDELPTVRSEVYGISAMNR